ncbi:MAG: hypothetical protein PHF00_14045 [Elusimicrobia bacterium]|nr:hypothetical protein [Elusimicrobiota bacterium]
MKNILWAVILTVAAVSVSFAAPPKSKGAGKTRLLDQEDGSSKKKVLASKGSFKPFYVYLDNASKKNHFVPSGWLGDYGDLKLNPAWTENTHGGSTCIKITYSARMTKNAGWAGIYWQNPVNNWGEKKGGFDLSGASRLSFWARGDKGDEKISEFKMGGISGEFPDSDTKMIGPVPLTKEWQKFTIDLKGKDLSHIIGGFCWSASKDDNPNGFTIYLDDIVYE